MTKKEKFDFDELEPLFSKGKVEMETYSDEQILDVINNPLNLQEIPRNKRANFWRNVAERAIDSPEFRDKLLKSMRRDKKDN